MTLTDDMLIEKSKQGDLEAFDLLVYRYEGKIYNMAYRFMGNHADAGDLAQETFIRLYKSLPTFRGESGFLTWLYRICANACRDELRRQKRRPNISWEEISCGAETANRSNNEPLPEEILERQELKATIQSCLDSLSEEHRLILVLREIQELSYDEIARVLDCTMGTVKSRLSRARLALKEKVLAHPELSASVKRQKRERGDAVWNVKR